MAARQIPLFQQLKNLFDAYEYRIETTRSDERIITLLNENYYDLCRRGLLTGNVGDLFQRTFRKNGSYDLVAVSRGEQVVGLMLFGVVGEFQQPGGNKQVRLNRPYQVPIVAGVEDRVQEVALLRLNNDANVVDLRESRFANIPYLCVRPLGAAETLFLVKLLVAFALVQLQVRPENPSGVLLQLHRNVLNRPVLCQDLQMQDAAVLTQQGEKIDTTNVNLCAKMRQNNVFVSEEILNNMFALLPPRPRPAVGFAGEEFVPEQPLPQPLEPLQQPLQPLPLPLQPLPQPLQPLPQPLEPLQQQPPPEPPLPQDYRPVPRGWCSKRPVNRQGLPETRVRHLQERVYSCLKTGYGLGTVRAGGQLAGM